MEPKSREGSLAIALQVLKPIYSQDDHSDYENFHDVNLMVIRPIRYLELNALRSNKINWRYTLIEMWVSNEIETIVMPVKG